ncbi:MAG: hypothetical protein WBQ29_01630, partial [Isosphaeraceae bacterium]
VFGASAKGSPLAGRRTRRRVRARHPRSRAGTGNGDAARINIELRPRFYLFFPLLLDLELPQAVGHAGLPGSGQIPPLRSRPFGGGYHGRGRCHILGSRGVGRDVAH